MATTPGIGMARQGELLKTVFKIPLDHPEGLPGREVLARMQAVLPPTEYELGHYESTPTENRVG